MTVLPLDKARGNNNNNQLNLFLYHVTRNATWANRDIPQQVKPGETGFPPLPLNLYYLVTAFGRDNDATKPFGHELLAKAMITLHDHTLLGTDEIGTATAVTLPRSDLHRQIERVRITFQPLTLDVLSKLWTGFAMQLRLSAAYEVSVALIESTQPVRAPLPTLTRGKDDRGVRSVADLTPPFPSLESIEVPNGQGSALLNDVLVLHGHNLDGTSVGVVFMHPLWTTPVEIAVPVGPDATAIAVAVKSAKRSRGLPAGIYTGRCWCRDGRLQNDGPPASFRSPGSRHRDRAGERTGRKYHVRDLQTGFGRNSGPVAVWEPGDSGGRACGPDQYADVSDIGRRRATILCDCGGRRGQPAGEQGGDAAGLRSTQKVTVT